MSRRRKSIPAQPLGYSELCRSDAYILDDVHCELAAYLEYSARQPFLPGNFLKSASSHLGDTLERKFTPEHIEGKLRLFWQHWGPVDANPSGFRKILTLGLKCLPRVPKEFHNEAQTRADDLEKSTSQPRKLRSASQTPNSIRTASPKRLRRKMKSRIRSARELYTNSPSPLRRAVAASTLTPGRRRQQSSAGISLHSSYVPRETSAIANPTTPISFKCERLSFEINDSQEKASDRGPASHLFHGQPQHPSFETPCTYDDLSQLDSPTPASCDHTRADIRYQSLLSQHELRLARIDILEVNLEDLRLQKNEEIEYLRRRCHQTEDKFVKLQAAYDRLHANATSRGSSLVATDDDRSLQERNSQLRRQIARLHTILAFSRTSPETFPRVDKAHVIENFDLMHVNSRDVLQDHDSAFNFDLKCFKDDHSLCGLFRRVFNIDPSQGVDPAEFDAVLVGISTRSMFRCLLSAAICEWVFEADLRSLFQECDRLYSHLRELLAGQDVNVTQCFEFSALQAALDDPMMGACIIPLRARMLARKFLQRLLPVIKSQGISGGSSDTIEIDWFGEEERLTEVFSLALQTATRLLVSTDLYRCVYHFPGTGFSSSMKRDVETSSMDAFQPATVAFTILPGLQRCAASERNLTFKRFLTAAEVQEGMAWESWCKPIVSSR